MAPLHSRISDALVARRNDLVALCTRIVAEGPSFPVRQQLPQAAIEQGIDALLRVLHESLEGRGTEMRDVYIETVNAGVLTGGTPKGIAFGGAVRFMMLVANDVTRHMSEPDQAPAFEWFATFFGSYFEEMAKMFEAG